MAPATIYPPFLLLAAACGAPRRDVGEPRAQSPSLLDALTARFPAPVGSVCPDPALRLTFASPVSLGSKGFIRVFDSAAPDSAVVEIDMARAVASGKVA